MSSAKQQRREELTTCITAQCRLEIEDVCDEAELPSETRDEITKNLMAGTERILDALSLDELGSELARARYLLGCAQDVRMEITRRQYASKRTNI
jgi:hypothetical protein